MKLIRILISVILLSLPIICAAQTYTADEYKHNENNWSLKESGEDLLIYEPEESKIWAKFHDDLKLELIGTPHLMLNYNGNIFWNSINTNVKRLRFMHTGIHAYCDYYDNFYFRANAGSPSALTLQGDGKVAIGFGVAYTDGYRHTTSRLAVNGNVTIGYDYSVSAPTNGLAVYGGSYFNNNVGIWEENTSGFELYVCGDALATGSWMEESDRRVKTNINSISGALDKIMQLKGTSFEYDLNNPRNKNLSPGLTYGLIAQDVLEVIPELVVQDGTQENYYSIKYSGIIPFLIEAIKDQQNQIESLQSDVNHLITENSNLKSESSITNNNNNPLIQSCTLDQNHPNPFESDTRISFNLSNEIVNSTLHIYDLRGSQIKSYQINDRGPSSVTVLGSELDPGTYIYTLIADGWVIDTKRMILTE